MTKECIRQRFRECVFQSLASSSNPIKNCETAADRFDALTEIGKVSPENAASIILTSFGATDAKNLLNRISAFVYSELENFNAKSPGVDTNPLTRIRRVAKTMNENLKKLQISINGVDVSQEMLEKATVRLPPCLSSPVLYQSNASEQNDKSAKLVLQVVF